MQTKSIHRRFTDRSVFVYKRKYEHQKAKLYANHGKRICQLETVLQTT